MDRFIGGGLPNTPVTYNESFTFEAWIYPQNNSVFHRGVILQSGIVWAVPLTSYVLQYDYQQQIVVAQVWTRMDDTWNVDEVASQGNTTYKKTNRNGKNTMLILRKLMFIM